MAFNSVQFFIFWFILYGVYLTVFQQIKVRSLILLLGNITFYTLLSGWSVILLFLASFFDFQIGKRISQTEDESQKKVWMRLSVVLNVALILGFRHVTDWLGLNQMNSEWHFPIPILFIGVSFYAFRSMSYVFDVYYENIETAEHNLIHYWTYASFFPIMLSGPILTASDFLDKLKSNNWGISSRDISLASFYITLGVVKKFILGNYIAMNFVDRVFESYSFFTGLEVFLASILQTFSLYLDFSGYTDIALGLGLLLGFNIPDNFNFPFLAQNVTEYWKRWHISLSNWFNAYLYFPLSYQLRQLKKFGTSLSVFVVFLISGFWHGTSPNYWVWGIMHALCMVWDIYSSQWRVQWRKTIPMAIYKPISIFITFGFLTYSGIYFKARTIESADGMINKILDGIDWSLFPDWFDLYENVALMGIGVIIFHYSMSRTYPKIKSWVQNQTWLISAMVMILTIFIAYQFNRLGSLPFYYLQF